MKKIDDRLNRTIAQVAAADRFLMRSLIASHGTDFAATFRVEFAEEVARATWQAVYQVGTARDHDEDPDTVAPRAH